MPEAARTVTVNVSGRALERLERLRLLTTANDEDSVVISALGVADELLGRVLGGEELLTRHRDGSVEYLEFQGLKSGHG